MGERTYSQETGNFNNQNSPTFYDCYGAKDEREIIQLIVMMPTDATLT